MPLAQRLLSPRRIHDKQTRSRAEEAIFLPAISELTLDWVVQTVIKTLTIRWPSGTEDKFQDLKANQVLSIREGTTKAEVQISPKSAPK